MESPHSDGPETLSDLETIVSALGSLLRATYSRRAYTNQRNLRLIHGRRIIKGFSTSNLKINATCLLSRAELTHYITPTAKTTGTVTAIGSEGRRLQT
jgi:hypothetical protein